MPPILKLMSGLPLIMLCSQVECKESAKPLTSENTGYELPVLALLLGEPDAPPYSKYSAEPGHGSRQKRKPAFKPSIFSWGHGDSL